jgi:hypothetical protein
LWLPRFVVALVVAGVALGSPCISLVPLVGMGEANAASEPMMRKACAGVEVRMIGVAAEMKGDKGLDAGREGIEVESSEGREITVSSVGPVLGSMDSSDVRTELACTADGCTVTATITRSAEFQGAALQNVLWRPKLVVALTLRQADVLLETIWRMRLTTGDEVAYAQTPGGPDEHYPIVVRKVLSIEGQEGR